MIIGQLQVGMGSRMETIDKGCGGRCVIHRHNPSHIPGGRVTELRLFPLSQGLHTYIGPVFSTGCKGSWTLGSPGQLYEDWAAQRVELGRYGSRLQDLVACKFPLTGLPVLILALCLVAGTCERRTEGKVSEKPFADWLSFLASVTQVCGPTKLKL